MQRRGMFSALARSPLKFDTGSRPKRQILPPRKAPRNLAATVFGNRVCEGIKG